MMAVFRPARPVAALSALVVLAGCVSGLPFAQPATKQAFSPADPALATPARGGSAVIDDLAARRAVLPAGGPFAAIADAVVAHASGATEAELRMRRLQAEARAKNWLPRIGPTVSLTSLGQVAAQIVLDQTLFDHGRRKAERAHAAADVEVAAVALVTDLNTRVHDGIAAWLTAEQARAQAAVAERAAARLGEYEGIIALRVQGGLSDRSEYQIITQTRAEMQATLQSDRQIVANALADLAALTGGQLPAVTGTDALPADAGAPLPLSVLATRAQGARTLAESDMARAGLLPGLRAQASLDQGGDITPGLTLGGATFGAGMGAERRAIDATPDLVDRRIAEAKNEAERTITRLNNEIASLRTRQQQGAAVLAQTQSNLDLFTEQYRLGGRGLVELVGQFAAAARLERDQVSLSFEIARLQLAITRDRGLLIDGNRI